MTIKTIVKELIYNNSLLFRQDNTISNNVLLYIDVLYKACLMNFTTNQSLWSHISVGQSSSVKRIEIRQKQCLTTIWSTTKTITKMLSALWSRVDPNYEPSRVVIENFLTEKLLRGVIVNSLIYKYSDDFMLGRDTYFVESFKNIWNIYQGVRIAFDSDQYKVRAFLGTCHWNENVGRKFTLISYRRDPKSQSTLIGEKKFSK